MAMTVNEAADALAARVRSTSVGFLTLRREELREAFGIGRLTESQVEVIGGVLDKREILIIPFLNQNTRSIRLYDLKHPIGDVLLSILVPDTIPETPIRQVAESLARERAGRELRSDDVPWPLAFDLFLQVVLGRDPEDWEELRDDRHPTELARTLAEALGFPPELADAPSTLRIAVAVGALRPRRRSWEASEFVAEGDDPQKAQPFLVALGSANACQKREFEALLHQAARLLLGSDEIPQHPIELGLLGLRYQREGAERAQG